MDQSVSTSRILMVEPVHFRTNPETLVDNNFQYVHQKEVAQDVEREARREFARCVELLREHGINVSVFEPHKECRSPDAVFCAHGFTTHVQLGGVFVLYPMRSPIRRTERSPEIIEFLRRRYPIEINLTQYEERGEFLEGAGSLVLDRQQRIAFMSSSTRSSERLAERWASLLGYRLLLFNATERDGRPIYHTELILSVNENFAIWCPEVIAEESISVVEDALSENREREIIEISRDQLMQFAGSMATLGSSSGRVHVFSSRAFNSLTDIQRQTIAQYGKLLHSPLDTIELYGGTSIGSMIAELV